MGFRDTDVQGGPIATMARDLARAGDFTLIDELPFWFLVFPFAPNQFRVTTVTGAESLSKPFSFEVTVTTHASAYENQMAAQLVGLRAVLLIRVGEVPRAIHGFIRCVRTDGRTRDGRLQFRCRLVPELQLFRHTRISRVFQNMSIPEVIEALFAPRLRLIWALSIEKRDFPRREYVVQYEESDLAFMERLLAEAGIIYYFVHPGATLELTPAELCSKEVMIGYENLPTEVGRKVTQREAIFLINSTYGYTLVGDRTDQTEYDPTATAPPEQPSRHAKAPEPHVWADDGVETRGPTPKGARPRSKLSPPAQSLYGTRRPLRFVPDANLGDEPWRKVLELVPSVRTGTNYATFVDYDPENPRAQLASAAECGGEPRPTDHPGGIRAIAPGLFPGMLEHYEHHGFFSRPESNELKTEAIRILQAKRRRCRTATGKSLCSGLTPGHTFQLELHPLEAYNQEYLVTAVRHSGSQDSTGKDPVYENRFECVPADVLYLPARPRRKNVQTALTATVVGPEGADIHVNESGCIRIRFHWDRSALGGSFSSCWVRTVQAWGGAQFIPRVGEEVVVTFEGGDPDKPIVLGTVYNKAHPPPFPLPLEKTRSGFRSTSTPAAASGLGNEVSFEDSLGQEQIRIHARRNLEQMVANDHIQVVQNDHRLTVTRDRAEEVTRNHAERVRGDSTTTVHGHATVEHLRSRDERVVGLLNLTVDGNRLVDVEGVDEIVVKGESRGFYETDANNWVSGNYNLYVGSDRLEKRAYSVSTFGTIGMTADDEIVLESKKAIVLRCGNSVLRLDDKGIELVGNTIRVAGEQGRLEASKDGIMIASDKTFAHFGDKLLVKTGDGRLQMGDEVKIDGRRILLNSPADAIEKEAPEPPPATEIELVDRQGNPLAKQPFVILLKDGSQRMGVTNDDGKAKLELPSDGQIRFPELGTVDESFSSEPLFAALALHPNEFASAGPFYDDEPAPEDASLEEEGSDRRTASGAEASHQAADDTPRYPTSDVAEDGAESAAKGDFSSDGLRISAPR